MTIARADLCKVDLLRLAGRCRPRNAWSPTWVPRQRREWAGQPVCTLPRPHRAGRTVAGAWHVTSGQPRKPAAVARAPSIRARCHSMRARTAP